MNKVDKILLLATGTLIGMGLIMVYSSSAFHAFNSNKGTAFFFQKQLIPLGIGIILCIILTKVDYHLWGKASYILLGITILLLIGVLFSPAINGVKRWIRIGAFSIQPSEFVKLTLIIFIAKFITQNDVKNLKKGFLPAISAVLITGALLVLEPSFGMLFVISASSLILLYIGGAKLLHITTFALIIIGSGIIGITKVPYAKARVSSFADFSLAGDSQQKLSQIKSAPTSADGYQLRQSLYGIGAGGFWGKGLGKGKAKLLFIPYPHTDFIFSIVGEELGFIGCVGVSLLFLLLLIRGIKLASRAQDKFGFLLANGISFAIFISMAVHIGVTCGILPTTGVPLPLISFGGSNLLSNLAGIGILLNISKTYEKQKAENPKC